MSKNKFYAVVKGNQPGIYNEWFGPQGAEAQIKGIANAVYKGFPTVEQAEQWFLEKSGKQPTIQFLKETNNSKTVRTANPDIQAALTEGKVVIFTDGACTGNPGPGGYGAVLLYGQARSELSGGYRLTTNNRMELLACITALQALKRKCSVILFCDSRYVVDGIMKGWARRWREKGWMRNKKDEASNPDLWAQLLDLCDKHEVQFVWVEGHVGITENERCDQLSVAETQKTGQPPDEEYENPQNIKTNQTEPGSNRAAKQNFLF